MATPNWAALEARLERLAASAQTAEQRQYIAGVREMLKQERARLASASSEEQAMYYQVMSSRIAQWEQGAQHPMPMTAGKAPASSQSAPAMIQPSSGGIPTWVKLLGGAAVLGGIWYAVRKR